MSDSKDSTHGLTLQIEDGKGDSPDVEVTIDGDSIDETRTAHAENGIVTFQVSNGAYEVVNVEPPGYQIGDETPSRILIEDEATTELLMLFRNE